MGRASLLLPTPTQGRCRLAASEPSVSQPSWQSSPNPGGSPQHSCQKDPLSDPGFGPAKVLTFVMLAPYYLLKPKALSLELLRTIKGMQ